MNLIALLEGVIHAEQEATTGQLSFHHLVRSSDKKNDTSSTPRESCSVDSFCSPWVYCDDGECRCGEIPRQILRCDVLMNTSFLQRNCITFNEGKGLIEAGNCIYIFIKKRLSINPAYTTLPRATSELNEFLCIETFNRNSTLCGACRDGYYPLAYSFYLHCVQCPNGKADWWKFVLAAFLPLTIFYTIVLFFNVKITHFYGFVFYSQTLSEPGMVRLLLDDANNPRTVTIRCILMLYGIWNLDFLRCFDLEICLETDSLQTLTLDLIVGVYPLLLMLVTCVLIELYDRNFRPLVIFWRPFYRCAGFYRRNWDVRTSLIDAFGTFFLLSNIKFLSVSYDLLIPVQVFQLNSTGHLTYSWRLYYDATVPYFGHRHLPYAILALAVLVVFVLLPVLLLILYPFHWFQKILNLFHFRLHILHTFMDSFQGCYKDGTEPGTRDCRWFSSVFLITRCLLMGIGMYTANSTYFPLAAIVLILVVILFIVVHPYKRNARDFTYINAAFTLLLALWYLSVLGVMFAALKGPQMLLFFICLSIILSIFPLIWISAYTLHWMYSNRRFGIEMIGRLCFRKHSYQILE